MLFLISEVPLLQAQVAAGVRGMLGMPGAGGDGKKRKVRSRVAKHTIDQLGFNQSYYTLSLVLLTKIVLCSKWY